MKPINNLNFYRWMVRICAPQWLDFANLGALSERLKTLNMSSLARYHIALDDTANILSILDNQYRHLKFANNFPEYFELINDSARRAGWLPVGLDADDPLIRNAYSIAYYGAVIGIAGRLELGQSYAQINTAIDTETTALIASNTYRPFALVSAPTDGRIVGTVQTTNATPAVIALVRTIQNRAYTVHADVLARRTDTANNNVYGVSLCGTFWNNAGTVTQIGSTTTTSGPHNPLLLLASSTLNINNQNVRVIATGEAGKTYSWRAMVRWMMV